MTLVSKVVFGFLDVRSALFLSLGAVPAAQLGAMMHKLNKPRIFYVVFSICLIGVSLYMFFY